MYIFGEGGGGLALESSTSGPLLNRVVFKIVLICLFSRQKWYSGLLRDSQGQVQAILT